MKLLAPMLAICGVLLLTERCEAFGSGGSDGRDKSVICAGGMVRINAPSELEQSLGCAAADMAIRRLAACDIILKQPFSISVSETVLTPRGTEAFGVFDPDGDVMNVTALAGLARMAAGTPYATLSPVALYKSVIAHETVHAVMQQNYTRKPTSRAAYEYPAYAIQMELLTLEHNGELNSRLVKSRDKPLLNDLMLGLDPFVFAAHAYGYLQDDGNRCSSLRDTLADRVDFIVTLPF
jgi:hypothetical protein